MSDTTIRVNKRENRFAQIDRRLINDKRISLDTRAMLIWLLDKPDGWKTTIGSLSSQLPSGRSVVRRMIQESETYGYIQRTATRHKGRFVYIYEVNEYPDNENLTPPCAVNRRGSADAVQPTRFSRRGSADAVNRPLSNTDISNTDHTNTDLNNTDHHHHQVPIAKTANAPTKTDDDDDDDDLFILNPHFIFSLRIAETMTGWTGYEGFFRGLSETQLIAAASWLYLYREGSQIKQSNPYALDYRPSGKSLFDGIDNPIGKIVTQARAGNIAPMSEDMRSDFSAEIKSIFDEMREPV